MDRRMSDLRFECNSCGESIIMEESQFEISSENESIIFGQEFDCPHCGNKTRASKLKPISEKRQTSTEYVPSWDHGIPVQPKPTSTSIRHKANIMAQLS